MEFYQLYVQSVIKDMVPSLEEQIFTARTIRKVQDEGEKRFELTFQEIKGRIDAIWLREFEFSDELADLLRANRISYLKGE